MTEKDKQIMKLMKDKEFVKLVRLIDNTNPFYVETIALRVYKKYQPKLSKNSVVLSKEEYEKIKSLYDCGNGYMTSQIGDLPLTVEGLRKAVDEITRLNRVEAELQELNAKYYNEAKDLRRKVNRLEAHAKINDEHLHIRIKEQARKGTAKEILQRISVIHTKNEGYTDWLDDSFYGDEFQNLCEEYGLKAIQTKDGVEVEE